MFETGTDSEPKSAEVQLRGYVDSARSALAAAAQLAVDEVEWSTLREVTLQIEQLRRFADATEAHALVQIHDGNLTDQTEGLATSRWLAHHAGLPSGAARQRVQVALKLREVLPQVDDALAEGSIGFDHARVLADAINPRNADAMLELIDQLIQASQGTVFHRWRRDVQGLAALLDQDGPHDPADDLLRNRLRLSSSDDFTMLTGELTGERALTVADTLNAIADELFLGYSRDAAAHPELEVPPRATLLALALEEICRRALVVDLDSTKAPRAEVTLVMHADRPEVVHDVLGSPIPASTVPSFLCDPVFYAAMVDSLGLPVDMGRATRHPTHAQRRAITVRDGGCTFPGCGSPPAWTDAHHSIEWGHDGHTDVRLLTASCRRHHRVAHRTGWSVVLSDDGWTSWTTPTGRTFWGQRHGRQRPSQQRAGP